MWKKATNGYGRTDIIIDRTTDMFNVDEDRGSSYSHDVVYRLLEQEGFSIEEKEDLYDAVVYEISWNKDLPKDKDRIGMKVK